MPDIEALTEKLMKDPDFQPKVGKTKLETATEEATQRVNQHRKNAAALSLAVEKKTAIETLSEHAEKQKELKEIDEMLFGVPSEDDREAMERELDIIELNVDTDIKLVSPPKNTSSQVKEELKTIIDLHLQTKEESENFELEISKPAKLQDLNIIKAFTKLAEELGLSDEITKDELKPIIKETAMIVMNLKYKFNRPRPYQLMDFHQVEFEPADFKSSKTPSYPSGHAFQGTLIAMILSQIFPLYSEKFMKLGESIGDNRVIFGVHYPSDNYAGIELAKQVYPFVNFDKLGFQAIPQESEPLEKGIPTNAVYSSSESPPKGTQVFYSEDQNKEYWIRDPQKQIDENAGKVASQGGTGHTWGEYDFSMFPINKKGIQEFQSDFHSWVKNGTHDAKAKLMSAGIPNDLLEDAKSKKQHVDEFIDSNLQAVAMGGKGMHYRNIITDYHTTYLTDKEHGKFKENTGHVENRLVHFLTELSEKLPPWQDGAKDRGKEDDKTGAFTRPKDSKNRGKGVRIVGYGPAWQATYEQLREHVVEKSGISPKVLNKFIKENYATHADADKLNSLLDSTVKGEYEDFTPRSHGKMVGKTGTHEARRGYASHSELLGYKIKEGNPFKKYIEENILHPISDEDHPRNVKSLVDDKDTEPPKIAKADELFLENEDNPRIARKKGQPAKSDKHSDLYTDEDPKDTIQGLGFKDEKTAESSVNKIKKSGRPHAHKIQAAVAMEQRAKAAGKTTAAGVYRKFINEMKEKTEEKEIEKHSEEHHTIEHGKEDKPFSMDDAKQSINDQLEQIKNKLETGDYGIEKSDMPLEKATGVEIAATGAALAAGGIALWDLYQTFKNNKKLTRDQRIELDEALEANEEEIKDIKVNFNEDQELPDLENTDNIAEIVEAAKDPEKAEDVVQKVRKKRWDAGKTAEERQKIREERDKKREGRETTPLAPIGELTPELDIDSVLRQAEESGLMDHIHEQIEGHGKDNPFHTKEDTVKSIKAKHKTPEKMKEYLGKQHGKFETFKAKAKVTEDKQEAKAKADADPNKKRWDLSNADEDGAYETAKEMIAHTLAHSSEHGGDGLDDKSVNHITRQLSSARRIMGSKNVNKLNNELKNNEIKPAKLDEEKVKEDYEGSDIPPESRGYGTAPEGVRVYTGPEDGKFYDKREESDSSTGSKSEGGKKGEDGKVELPEPTIPDDSKVSTDKPVGEKASSWGDKIGSAASALGRFGGAKGDDRKSLIDQASEYLKETAQIMGSEFTGSLARNLARSRGYGEAEAQNAKLKNQLQAVARGIPIAGKVVPKTEGYVREARAGVKGAAREEAAKQRAAEDKLRFGDNIDFEVNKSDVKKLQDFIEKGV